MSACFEDKRLILTKSGRIVIKSSFFKGNSRHGKVVISKISDEQCVSILIRY